MRREYNFGTSRTKLFPFKHSGSIDEHITDQFEIIENQEDHNYVATEEEQKEVRESILPCSCAFHYKNTLIDQLILVPMSSMTEGLLFSRKSSLTSVPLAFQRTLKELGARDVKFSPWKVYLGKWERRVWSCELPARKLLLHEAFLSLKVTDSIISRHPDRICIESLMQIDGIPGGGSFVKWKVCVTSPKTDSPASEQCRITITAAAASPLGSWFKGKQKRFLSFLYCLESIRAALLQHAEELWSKAIENAASVDYSEETTSDSRSLNFSGSESLSKLIFSQNIPNSLNSVTLTYFDRKSFLLSIGRIASAIVVVLLAVLAGNKFMYRRHVDQEDLDLNRKSSKFNDFQESVQVDYFNFLEKSLKLNQNYPEILEQAAGEFTLLEGQLTEIVGQVYRIQREIGDQRINI